MYAHNNRHILANADGLPALAIAAAETCTHSHIDCAVINTLAHTHTLTHICFRRLDFSQCKKPAAPNGTCTVYMHFPLHKCIYLSLFLSNTAQELRKRTEQSRQTCVFFLFFCVAHLLINKHALWQGLLNQAPTPHPAKARPSYCEQRPNYKYTAKHTHT